MLCILLVEDSEITQMLLQDYLTNKGYQVIAAQNGQEALEHIDSMRFHLIVLDIQLPGIHGFEVIQRVRATPEVAHTPIVALTAMAMPGDREKCLLAGADAYLSKPVRLVHLVQTIEQYALR
jgi:CheY-like chemotaxis protein